MYHCKVTEQSWNCAFRFWVGAERRKLEMVPSYSSWCCGRPGPLLRNYNQGQVLLWPGQRQKDRTQHASFQSCSYLTEQRDMWEHTWSSGKEFWVSGHRLHPIYFLPLQLPLPFQHLDPLLVLARPFPKPTHDLPPSLRLCLKYTQTWAPSNVKAE